MNLSLADGTDVAATLHLPPWVAGGLGFAVILTAGVILTLMSVKEHDSLIGFGATTVPRAAAMCFVVYGLIPGMIASWLWFHESWWIGVIVASIALDTLWHVHVWADHKFTIWYYSKSRSKLKS